MRHFSVLLLLLALPVAAQTVRPCPDNGESSSTRTIRATSGTPVDLATVPKGLRDAAVARFTSFMFGNHPPPDAEQRVKPSAARKYAFGATTFYTVTVGRSQTIVSAACPHARCTRDWWPTDAKILADRDRPPTGAPGDEFYLITKETPKGHALLVTSESTSEEYDLVESCLVTIADANAPLRMEERRPSAGSCVPDAFTLCLMEHRFTITATRRAGGARQPAQVGARGLEAGTFGLFAPDYWDVLVNMDENCRATKTFIIKYVSMNTDPYDLTVTDTSTGITRTFSKTGPPAEPFTYDNTTFRCK